MSDKEKFLKLTKKVRFRNTKKIFSLFSQKARHMRERILYLFNYILYKINILNKKDYRTNGEKFLCTLFYEEGVIKTGNVCAFLKVNVFEYNYVHQEYFYRKTKYGEKITYVICDVDHTEYKLYGVLDNIGVKLSNQDTYYLTNGDMPHIRFKEEVKQPLRPYDPTLPLIKPKVDTYTFDVSFIRGLRQLQIVPFEEGLFYSTEPLSINEELAKYMYLLLKERFEEYLNRDFTISKIIVKEKPNE